MKSYLKRLSAIMMSSIVLSSVAFTASSANAAPKLSPGVLAGRWQITLVGNTGCGLQSILVNVTLNAAGVGNNAVIKGHGQCGDSVTTGQTFKISGLNNNRTGKASLSCGVGCGWGFDIQASRNLEVFNLVDVEPTNPNNYLAGVAVRL